MKGGPIGGRTNSPQRSSIALVSQRRALSKSPDFLLQIASSIQRRDRQICVHLFNHKVLTTHHIQDLFFENDRVCRRRLAKLTEFGLVVPFRPQASRGSYPNHFILGDLGLYLVAAEFGVEVKELGLKKDRLTRLAFSPKLNHLLTLNGFFCRLIRECQRTDDQRILAWFGEKQCAKRWGEVALYPDAEAVVGTRDKPAKFLFEMDMGTENLKRLEEKFARYWKVNDFHQDIAHSVLFCFLDPRREAVARKILDRPPLPVFTGTMDRHMGDPLGPNWLGFKTETLRWRICELPRFVSRSDEYRAQLLSRRDDDRGQ